MSVAPPDVCRKSGQNAGGTAEEEWSPPCLFLFLPFFPKDPETCVDDRTLVVKSRMTVPMSLFSASSLSACVHPFTCTVWSPKGSRAFYPFSTSCHLPLIVLCPCAEIRPCCWRISCMLSGSQLPFLLDTAGAALSSSSAPLIQSYNIQGCIKLRVEGPPFSLAANKR